MKYCIFGILCLLAALGTVWLGSYIMYECIDITKWYAAPLMFTLFISGVVLLASGITLILFSDKTQ